MGNSLGGRKTTKVMKINGETMKFTKPIRSSEIVKDYPNHVLLDSESVKHFGVRAKPLEPEQELKPKRLYFLVELPKFPEEKSTRRVRSNIQMSAKDRLESLLLARRSVSDLSLMKTPNIVVEKSEESSENGVTRLKMRLTKAEVEKLMMESKDENEVAEKIFNLCMGKNGGDAGGDGGRDGGSGGGGGAQMKAASYHQQAHWRGDVGMTKSCLKPRERRVGFMPINEAEIQLVTAS